jgi:hypothetical protein
MFYQQESMDPELKIHVPICNGWWHQLQHVMKASKSLKIGSVFCGSKSFGAAWIHTFVWVAKTKKKSWIYHIELN